jgi:hypothetical protein
MALAMGVSVEPWSTDTDLHRRHRMDLVKRAGELKPMLVKFAMSPLFDRELSEVIAEAFPDMIVDDEAMFSMVLDHFALQHRLESGTTVVEAFVAAHSELTEAEQDMLLGWRNVVEGMFEFKGRDRDAAVLFNFVDELTYRARSNLGPRAFRQLKKDMIIIGRLVPVGEAWMVSGNLSVYPASARGGMLVAAARQALSNPEAAFRNPAKLAEAQDMVARQYKAFVDLFGGDLVVVPGIEVPDKVQEFEHHWAHLVCPDGEPTEPVAMDFPDDLLGAESVAIHFVAGEGMSFYPDYHLLEELFGNPALIARRRYRETLSDFLYDPDTSPEPLRRLAARDPAKASKVFSRLLKHRGFSWEADGEGLLRELKPSYFDGTLFPRTVVLSEPLSKALRDARH